MSLFHGLTIMRLNVRTLLHRRQLIITLLRSIAIPRSRGSIHLASNKRTIDRGRNNTPFRRPIGNHLSTLLNRNISKKNDLIRSGRQKLNRRRPNGARRLPLANKRITTNNKSKNVVTLKRPRSGIVNINHLNNNCRILLNNDKATRLRVIPCNANK